MFKIKNRVVDYLKTHAFFWLGAICGAFCFFIICEVIFPVFLNHTNLYYQTISKWNDRTHVDLESLVYAAVVALISWQIYVRRKGRFTNFITGFCGSICGLASYIAILAGVFQLFTFYFDSYGLLIDRWEHQTGLPLGALLDPGLIALLPCIIYACIKRRLPKFAVAFSVSIIVISTINIVNWIMFPDY